MLNFFTSTMFFSVDHQSTSNDRLKPVMTAGLVNKHIGRSIANLAAIKFEFRGFQFYRRLQWVLFYTKVFHGW